MVRHRQLRVAPIGLLLLSLGSGCAAQQPASQVAERPAAEGQAGEADASIGTASQEADGTLVLMLRATGPGGAISESMKRYPPSDPHYEAVRRHVGPIPKGATVPVRPFP